MAWFHAELTYRSLVVITATRSTPSPLSLSVFLMKPGRCWSLHVGVKAPGMPTRMVVPLPSALGSGSTAALTSVGLPSAPSSGSWKRSASISISGKAAPSMI